MNATLGMCLEDECGYEAPDARSLGPQSERVAMSTSRSVTGQQRVSRQARHSRRATPQRMSGSHRRGNKRYGL